MTTPSRITFARRVRTAAARAAGVVSRLVRDPQRLTPWEKVAAILTVLTFIGSPIAWIYQKVTTPPPHEDLPACQVPLAEHDKSGYLLVDGAQADPHVPGDEFECNSAGRANSVERLGTGVYRVRFGGLGSIGGIAEVTPAGPRPRICVLADWRAAERDELVDVRCFDAGGAPADSRFWVRFQYKYGTSGATAYVRTYYPTMLTSVAEDGYSYNSKGGMISVDRLGVGHYVAFFPGQQQPLRYGEGGVVKVTAVGTQPAICVVDRWYPKDSFLAVAVRCHAPGGVPTDSTIAVSYSALLGAPPERHVQGAYAWAHRTNLPEHVPHEIYQHSSRRETLSVSRSGPGRYEVRLPRFTRPGGHVQVSAYQTTTTCAAGDPADGDEVKVVPVNCWAGTGEPADSRFTLIFWQ